MYSTGPLFLSVIWQDYKRLRRGGDFGGASEEGRVRVLLSDEYNKKPWSFFRWHGGSSWHGKDARLIFWMGRHWMLLTVSGFLIAGVLGLGLWWICGRVLVLGDRRRKAGTSLGTTSWFGFGGRWVGRISPLWRRVSPGKGYELVERHEV